MRLGDVVEELAFGLAFFECLLVEDIGKVHVWFIIRSEAVPQVLTADAKAETHCKGKYCTLCWCQILEPPGDGAKRATTSLEDHVTHRVGPPGASGR
ncbi:hypothetical protein GCM10009039_33970 [Halocalculus aciditolerans]|uniref:Uncharacterized protein n=1 Tax=Halocalculus aciditolerans TaxID=1383812 RepID=A0A830FNI4_9EURY|nr:hypothetical protein GCM10009039_33970 [Halocalculus aciditolerans]